MKVPDPSSALDHIVVLMFENRSFDNLLGYLYKPGEVPNFEGIYGKDLSNPIPAEYDREGRNRIFVHRARRMDTPDPDPGEEYPHVNTQMYGTVNPEENQFAEAGDMKAPFNLPGSGEKNISMDGFVRDYINRFRQEMGRLPSYDEYSQIMGCFMPDQVPVISTLAREFACFDHWFCEVPSQTFPNRSFFHAATSSGFVINPPYGKFATRNRATTIFDRLEEKGISWKVYIDPEQMIPATGLIHASRLIPEYSDHFVWMKNFYLDCKNGDLPAYSFIEPNMVYPHTDMHPPLSAKLRNELHLPPPQHIRGGELLLGMVYDSIRKSASPDGSNWSNTLLLVTFDEHGGTYDHVPPPRVSPPGDTTENEMGFGFDISGLRVPAIAVSAWIDPNTVINEEFRHTSVIRTLREKWSLGGSLTARDAEARDLASIFTRSEPRNPSEWPEIKTMPWTFKEGILTKLMRPLSRMETEFLGELIQLKSHLNNEPAGKGPEEFTRRKARKHMSRGRKQVMERRK